MRYFTITLFICFSLACTKKKTGKCTFTCNQAGIHALFSGYMVDDVDSVYIKEFKRNGLFDSLISTKLHAPNKPDSIPSKHIYGLGFISLSPYRDYEVHIPATGQTFRIATSSKTVVDTAMCDNIPRSGCRSSYPSATITGGSYDILGTSPLSAYLIFKK